MSSPLVSVVIPTHNRVGIVPGAIDSALAQTWHDLEVVVVDDGSTDGTIEALRVRYGSDPRVRVVGRPNGGVAAARNTGIEAARGDYLGFLDSDDAWLPWKLELQIGCLERDHTIGMTWTDLSAFDSNGLVAERHLRRMYRNIRDRKLGDVFARRSPVGDAAPISRPDLARIPVYVGDVFDTMLLGSIVHTSTVVIRATILDKVGLFDETLRPNGEDFDFHLRTTEITDVAYVDIPSIRYRIGSEDQLSGQHQMVPLARNGLRTVSARLEAAAADSRVTSSVRKQALAAAQAWLGRELAATGRGACALRHLIRSWLLRPTARIARSIVGVLIPYRPSRLRSRTATGERGARSG